MNAYQLAWLHSRGYDPEKHRIRDCDPDACTVTFADGTIRQLCEIWTRVMGYHRPTHAFNAGKQSEHTERRYFVERPGDLGSTACVRC